LDMATEEFFQFSTPLGGLDALQAQAQEQQSAVSHIPLIVLLGITPTGLNASSEGELRVFYDYVRGYQTNVMGALMNDVATFVQLSLFGEVDDSIQWNWAPLLELTALEMSDKNNKDADTDSKYLQEGVVSPEQVAQRLNSDPNSPYSGLLSSTADMSDVADDDIAGITGRIVDETTDMGGAPAGAGADIVAPGGDLLALTGPTHPLLDDAPAATTAQTEPQSAIESLPQQASGAPQSVATPTANPAEAGTPDEQGDH
ncbi:anti-CBASS protein Acb1 family protein, partial [Paraburkholderia sp.]|uniref:anti-CBASS protein Acb1 family protein n=1 Tax=Paraburkholderia sp. TaxID=1926495 RepID=UPI002F410674